MSILPQLQVNIEYVTLIICINVHKLGISLSEWFLVKFVFKTVAFVGFVLDVFVLFQKVQ